MKRAFFALLTLAVVGSATAQECTAGAEQVRCPYPADPINWVMRYCGVVTGTDDEVVIQESACFKQAQADLNNKDQCAVKKQYKTKLCEKATKESKATKSVSECLKDASVQPFFAGG